LSSGLTTESQGDNNSGINWAGVIVVLFGLLFAASQSNELMGLLVVEPGSAADQGISAACRADELEEENLSQRECELMVANVQIVLALRPEWVRGLMIPTSVAGALLAIVSIVVGLGLAGHRRWATQSAIYCFGLLLLIDLIGFFAMMNTGPLLRARYLWNILLWFFIHLCMVTRSFADRGSGNELE
jgi:hypothetical protein